MRYCLYLHVMGMTLTACTSGQPNTGAAQDAAVTTSIDEETPASEHSPPTDENGSNDDTHEESHDEGTEPGSEPPQDGGGSTSEVSDTGLSDGTSPESPEPDADDTVLMDELHWAPDTGLDADTGVVEPEEPEDAYDDTGEGDTGEGDTEVGSGTTGAITDPLLTDSEGGPTADDDTVPTADGDDSAAGEPDAEDTPTEHEETGESEEVETTGEDEPPSDTSGFDIDEDDEDASADSDDSGEPDSTADTPTDDGDSTDATDGETADSEPGMPEEGDEPPTTEEPPAEPGVGDTCGVDGFIYDCGMVCTLDLWVGDGSCDDESRPYGDWFACAELDWDGGDCEPIEIEEPEPEPEPEPEVPSDPEPVPCADEGWIEDCTGKCSLDSWRGDGWCDDADSPFGADFDCTELSFDGGDCTIE